MIHFCYWFIFSVLKFSHFISPIIQNKNQLRPTSVKHSLQYYYIKKFEVGQPF